MHPSPNLEDDPRKYVQLANAAQADHGGNLAAEAAGAVDYRAGSRTRVVAGTVQHGHAGSRGRRVGGRTPGLGYYVVVRGSAAADDR